MGKHSCSQSEPKSGLMRILSILAVGMDASVLVEPMECGGEGGVL